MSREIEFRAWIIEKNKYVFNKPAVSELTNSFNYITGEYILEQYINRVDENGTKIFEGDICNFTIILNGKPFTKQGTIIWMNGIYRTNDQDIDSWVSAKLEVIGNIHEGIKK